MKKKHKIIGMARKLNKQLEEYKEKWNEQMIFFFVRPKKNNSC